MNFEMPARSPTKRYPNPHPKASRAVWITANESATPAMSLPRTFISVRLEQRETAKQSAQRDAARSKERTISISYGQKG